MDQSRNWPHGCTKYIPFPPLVKRMGVKDMAGIGIDAWAALAYHNSGGILLEGIL